MRIEIKNVGQIEKAVIDLEGITVIAGENNTGKSTIGKTVFALLCGMNQWKDIYFSRCRASLKKVMEKNSLPLEEFCLSHTDAARRRTSRADRLLNQLSSDEEFLAEIEDYQIFGDQRVHHRLTEYYRYYIALYKKNDVQQLIDENKKYLDTWVEAVLKDIDNIELDEAALQANYIKNSFTSCFKGQYVTEDQSCSEIILYEKQRENILKMSRVESIISAPIRFENGVYFIESPKIFDEIGTFGNGREGLRRLMIPNTFMNIFSAKAGVLNYSIGQTFLDNEIPKEAEEVVLMLQNAMNGQAEYYVKEGIRFKENGIKESLYPQNVSTGVKALAFLEYAVRLGAIQKSDILILDEPEINLHPQWQIVYARALVLLQKAYHLTLIITTHSPYFMRALECFSDKYDSMSNLNVYYVSRNSNGQHSIKNVINSEYGMTEVYEKLSAAFEELQDEIDELYGYEEE